MKDSDPDANFKSSWWHEVDLGGSDGVVDRLTVRQAVGQAGGVATESQGKREVQGEPGVANLFLII